MYIYDCLLTDHHCTLPIFKSCWLKCTGEKCEVFHRLKSLLRTTKWYCKSPCDATPCSLSGANLCRLQLSANYVFTKISWFVKFSQRAWRKTLLFFKSGWRIWLCHLTVIGCIRIDYHPNTSILIMSKLVDIWSSSYFRLDWLYLLLLPFLFLVLLMPWNLSENCWQ